MFSRIPSCFVFLVLSQLTASAWDFTPREARTFVDGPSPRHYYLQSDTRKINLRIDLRTQLVGSSAVAVFRFSDLAYATLRITQSPLALRKLPFAGNLPLYQEAARRRLPVGSTDIVLEGESENVYPINNWTSHQFTFRYGFYGRTIRTSLTFLNYDATEQWLLDLSSSPVDFDKASSRASRVLNSFHETDLNYKLENNPN